MHFISDRYSNVFVAVGETPANYWHLSINELVCWDTQNNA